MVTKISQKAYNHISVLTLSHIKRVIDVNETAGKEGFGVKSGRGR